MDGQCEDSTKGPGRIGLAFKGNVVKSRARIDSARKHLQCVFIEEVDSLKY